MIQATKENKGQVLFFAVFRARPALIATPPRSLDRGYEAGPIHRDPP